MRTLLALGVLLLGLPALAADTPTKLDRYGDPLPQGALMRLGTLRLRAPITGFGIEKDGTVVTVGPSTEVRRWHKVDDRSDEPVQLPLKGTETSNNYPQVSPDGKLVAACSNEKVFVWETPTEAKTKPKEVVFDLADVRLFRFSPDSTKLVAVTSRDQASAVHLCDIKTGKRSDPDCTPAFVAGVAFSGDGKRLGVDGRLDFYLLDTVTGKQLAKYEAEGMSEFALNHTGDVLAVVDRSDFKHEFRFRFTDPLTGKKLDGLTAPEGRVDWLTFVAGGKTLLLGDRYNVRWWDPVAGKLIRTFDGLASPPSDYFPSQRTPGFLSPDGKALVAHNGSALLRWDAVTGKPRFSEQDIGHGGVITGIGLSADGKRIATRATDNRVCVWDAATGKELSHASAGWLGSAHIDFSPDGKYLFVGSPGLAEATKIDAETGKVVTTFVASSKGPRHPGYVTVRLSKDGKTLFGLAVRYSEDAPPESVIEWDAATGERKKVTPIPFSQGAFSPDATLLARGYPAPGVVPIAEPKTNLLKSPNVTGFSIDPGCFSADGKWYALVNVEKKGERAYVVSTTNWEVVCKIDMENHGRIALSPDGQVLALSQREKIEFFDTATARLLGNHRIPDTWTKSRSGNVSTLQFTPDGTKLISGHKDTTALVWPVPRLAK